MYLLMQPKTKQSMHKEIGGRHYGCCNDYCIVVMDSFFRY